MSKVVVIVVADVVVIIIHKCSFITFALAVITDWPRSIWVDIDLRGGTTLASQMYSSFYVCSKPCMWHP